MLFFVRVFIVCLFLFQYNSFSHILKSLLPKLRSTYRQQDLLLHIVYIPFLAISFLHNEITSSLATISEFFINSNSFCVISSSSAFFAYLSRNGLQVQCIKENMISLFQISRSWLLFTRLTRRAGLFLEFSPRHIILTPNHSFILIISDEWLVETVLKLTSNNRKCIQITCIFFE